MTAKERAEVEVLLANPDHLLKKEPFWRELSDRSTINTAGVLSGGSVGLTDKVTARLPRLSRYQVTQEQFAMELDVHSHKCLFDENLPSITIKNVKDGYVDIEQYRMSIPFQVLVRDKQVRHLCVNNIGHTLLNTSPDETQSNNFVRFKQGWNEKNVEGHKTKMVKTQKSYGDAGLLFFMNEEGRLCMKDISFEDGYVIITHKNDEGKHILECLYYSITDSDGNSTVYIDCYDDEKMTRFTDHADAGAVFDGGWVRQGAVYHGFSENPLITKRGNVAWDRGQRIIESYEALYNTYIVVEKRHGWGIVYVKGKLNPNAKKLAGQIVLNDTSMDPAADAKILDPPSSQNTLDCLEKMEQSIMIACGTTFILPKDIKISGDTSGLAVEMTQELDMATAQDGVTEWQNVANKMARLFKEGFAKELVNTGENAKAVTEYDNLRIHSEFQVWKPKSEEGHNQMLATLKGAGGISQQTFVEKNTVSTPDEMMRIRKEHEAELREQEAQARKAAQLSNNTSEQTIVTEK